MNVVVTGTGGRLGAAVARHLRLRHRVVAYDRKSMDLRSCGQISDHLGGLTFDALINCAAVTSVDYCEQHPDEAREVNALAPLLMARHCRERSARMIQISTDYVYDGTLPGLRREEDPVAPLGVYAVTKREGEEAVLSGSSANIVARTSWVFGPDRESFVDQIIARAQKDPSCGAIGDKVSSCSYSLDMAAQLERLLENPAATGVFNLCNDGACSWLELGQAAVDIVSQLGWKLRSRTLQSLRLADMKSFIAPRPVFTAMDVSKLPDATGLRPRPWREALEDYLTTYYSIRFNKPPR
jgi:dTDP-4-dehydrorhamnose reductase